MQPTNMTWDEMVQFITDNPLAKITHPLFAPTEYIYYDGTNVLTEEGYLFEDFMSEGPCNHDGLRMRRGGDWERGWSCIENPNCF